MAYQALYRQWRPKTFSEMVAQQAVVTTLRNQVIGGRISHAYLFCGSRGTGKTSSAKIPSLWSGVWIFYHKFPHTDA